MQSLIEETIILGIDIGTNVMGFGLIKTNVKNMEIIDMKELFLDRISDETLKVKKIFKVILDLIDNYSPTVLVIESPFIGKNLQSSIKIGITQGIAAALYKKILFFEYSTRKIKMYITGNATKELKCSKDYQNVINFLATIFILVMQLTVCHYVMLCNVMYSD